MKKLSKEMFLKKNKEVIVAMIFFITYLYYNDLINQFISLFKIEPTAFTAYIGDIIFLGIITTYYFDNLVQSFQKLKKEKISKILLFVFSSALFIVLITVLMTSLEITLIKKVDRVVVNNDLLYDLNIYYRIFKVMIYSVIAEELLFRKVIRNIIDNKYIFIISSALIYAYMNIAFLGYFNGHILFEFTTYFIIYAFLNAAYVKKDNILAPISIKFVSALIIVILSALW